MSQDWIFDVLADLEAFARLNGLPVLAAHVSQAQKVARAEIAGENPGPPEGCGSDRHGGDKNPPPGRG